MDDARLNLRFREDGSNRFGKALEYVNAGDENIQFWHDLSSNLRV
jgi:hypothetical protein